jgi:hypothetical protein
MVVREKVQIEDPDHIMQALGMRKIGQGGHLCEICRFHRPDPFTMSPQNNAENDEHQDGRSHRRDVQRDLRF